MSSCNAPNDNNRLQAISQAYSPGSLAQYGLMVPWFIRLPPWALITCGVFALARGMLREIIPHMLREVIPQESADRLAWWRYVLDRKRQPTLRLPNRSGKRSNRSRERSRG
jgi:hypothetical protein